MTGVLFCLVVIACPSASMPDGYFPLIFDLVFRPSVRWSYPAIPCCKGEHQSANYSQAQIEVNWSMQNACDHAGNVLSKGHFIGSEYVCSAYSHPVPATIRDPRPKIVPSQVQTAHVVAGVKIAPWDPRLLSQISHKFSFFFKEYLKKADDIAFFGDWNYNLS